MLNGCKRRTGDRNRRHTCDSEYHIAPKCPQRKQWTPASAIHPPPANKAPRSSLPSIPTENPPAVRMDGCRRPSEGGGVYEKSLPTTSEVGNQLISMKQDSVVISNTGAAVNIARLRRLSHHSSLVEKMGRPRVPTYTAKARFKFGNGRMDDGALLRISQEALRAPRATLRPPSWARKFRLYRVKGHWKPWEDSCFFLVMHLRRVCEGPQFPSR